MLVRGLYVRSRTPISLVNYVQLCWLQNESPSVAEHAFPHHSSEVPLSRAVMTRSHTLTQTEEASEHRRLLSRQKRFIASPRWKRNDLCRWRIGQKSMDLSIESIGSEFRVSVDSTPGKGRFSSIVDAKSFAFDSWESGVLGLPEEAETELVLAVLEERGGRNRLRPNAEGGVAD